MTQACCVDARAYLLSELVLGTNIYFFVCKQTTHVAS